MLMNYHELTMEEPRDSPQRRKQYLVICTVMGVFFLHAVFTSGIMQGVDIEEGEFHGGNFIYKYTSRDSAAAMALQRGIAKNAGIHSRDFQDKLYSVYLDDPSYMSGRRQRFAAGILSPGGDLEKKLIALNKPEVLSIEDQQGEAVDALIAKLHYEKTSLPKAKAAILQFPFTNGFMSAIVLSYKIIPKMRKYVKEHGDDGTAPVVLSTCDIQHGMCTHYAPLSKTKKFLLGQPATETYLASLPPEKTFDWRQIVKGTSKTLGRHFSFLSSAKKPIDKEL